MKELVIGAGNSKTKNIFEDDNSYKNPVYLDIDESSNPDIIWDLNVRPLPFDDEEFDEIHAYEILEHIGNQGDWKGFFEEWNEYYRLLKPKGRFYGSCPSTFSPWLWGDPGHTRVINHCTLAFLVQTAYEEQVGVTAMTDYRSVYQGNFKPLHLNDDKNHFFFVLEKL